MNTSRYTNLGKFIEEFLAEVRKAADEAGGKASSVVVEVAETDTDLADAVKRKLK